MIDKVKLHVKNHKTAYMVGGAMIAGVVVGVAITRRSPISYEAGRDIYAKVENLNQTNVLVSIEALGDPGNVVQDLVTGTIYASQNQAAKAMGCSSGDMSKHLAGLKNHIEGHTFQRIAKAPVVPLSDVA